MMRCLYPWKNRSLSCGLWDNLAPKPDFDVTDIEDKTSTDVRTTGQLQVQDPCQLCAIHIDGWIDVYTTPANAQLKSLRTGEPCCVKIIFAREQTVRVCPGRNKPCYVKGALGGVSSNTTSAVYFLPFKFCFYIMFCSFLLKPGPFYVFILPVTQIRSTGYNFFSHLPSKSFT